MFYRNNNRRRVKMGAHSLGPPLAVLLLSVPILALLYLWLGDRCEAVGRKIQELDVEYKALQKECLYEESRWIRTKSPQEITAALQRHRLNMVWPSERQIVRIYRADLLGIPAAGKPDGRSQYARAGTLQ